MSRPISPAGTSVARDRVPRGLHRPFGRGDDVLRELQDDAALVGSGAGGADLVEPVGLDEAVAHGTALGRDERERHGAADQQRVDAFDEGADRPELVRDLGPAEHGDVRVRRARRAAATAPRPRAGAGARRRWRGPAPRSISGSAATRGVGPVHGAERVVDVRVGEAGEALRERAVVRLLPGSNRRFSSSTSRPGSNESASHDCSTSGLRTPSVGTYSTTRPSAFASARRPARAAGPRPPSPFGRPRCEAATIDAPRSSSSVSVGMLARIRASSVTAPSWSGTFRSRRTKTRRPATSPRSSSVRRRTGAYSERATRSTRSTSRFEYPHSLSYQPMTFATAPIAIVDAASNVHEAGLPTMSDETIGILRVHETSVRQWPALGGGTVGGVHLVHARLALQRRHEIGHRAVRHRHPHRQAVHPALQVRQDQSGRLRGPRRGGDDVDRRGPRPPKVLVRAGRGCSGRSCTRGSSS